MTPESKARLQNEWEDGCAEYGVCFYSRFFKAWSESFDSSPTSCEIAPPYPKSELLRLCEDDDRVYKRGASSLDQGDVVGLCVFPRRKVPFGPMFSNRCLPSHDNHTLSILFKRARAPHIVAPLGHVKDFDPIGIAHRCTVRDTRYVLQLALQRSTSPAKGCTIKELLYKRNTDPTRRKKENFAGYTRYRSVTCQG